MAPKNEKIHPSIRVRERIEFTGPTARVWEGGLSRRLRLRLLFRSPAGGEGEGEVKGGGLRDVT